MGKSKDIVVDPWLKGADETAGFPEDAFLACAYYLDTGVDIVEEAVFFRRTDSTDALWIMAGPRLPDMQLTAGRIISPDGIEKEGLWGIGCAYAVEKSNDDFSACLGLLDRLFRARANYYWPGELISPGIINGPAYNALIWNIEHEMEENTRKARERETEIVRVARELGFSPQPSGTDPGHWMARCPEKNHHLYINAETNSFGCGWCKRKGSVEELKVLVEERKQRRQE